ncbi:MafB [Ligilactobacillus ruminis]|uniref:MafB n=1 Tax=Ligilactobacillus ruminis TaxID=1623 RepID=UPI0032C16367
MNIDIQDNNRKNDKPEYLEFTKKLDAKFVPISLAKFQELKYNDVEICKELKDRVVWSEAKFPSEKSLNGHFKFHGDEFANISKEQYRKATASLLAEPVSENILGYDTEFRRVRYDRKNNIYVLGNPKTKRITTMFRPKEGKEYYDGEVSKDLGN